MNKITDESYLDLMIDSDIVHDYGPPEDITPLTDRISMIQVNDTNLDICALGHYPYHFFPSIFTLNASIADSSGIERVQDNPNFALYGNGVLVGIIDTGIDYRHPAFVNGDNTSRIYSLWDQTINENNTPPNGFSYGTEFEKTALTAAVQNPNPLSLVPSQDEIGHGTMIAGIVAGNDARTAYSGVVPQAELVVVKLKQAKKSNRRVIFAPEDAICYQETDIISGINYVMGVARKLERPIALCIALGTSQTGHDGKGAISGFLNNLAQSPRLGIAISGGNEANRRRHYKGESEAGGVTTFELRVGEKDSVFSMEIWQKAPQRIQLSITSPTGQSFTHLYPTLNECRRLNFLLEPSVLWVNNIVTESETGDQLILVRFQNAQSGLWRFSVEALEKEVAEFHAWLPSGDLISEGTYFPESDPDTTITSPGNTTYPLTVANYDTTTNSIVIDSSRGYTRTNFVKPDLAAPGKDIPAPLPNSTYGTGNGTGTSAAIAAGIMAMVLEWAVLRGNYTTINGTDVSSLLVRGAVKTQNIDYPNKNWGYGVIDIYGLFEKLI
ncbi:hypothetical protein FACS1894111_02780 [Clostridia bacterium]|nr:hypothetical protein FACS1894111_02780 [Clostridia bacterium]